MSYVAFTVGMFAGSVLFLAGLEKILSPTRAATRAWTPASVGDFAARGAVVVVGLTEAIVAAMGFVPLVPRPVAITAIASLALVITAYGFLALKSLGTCGCGSAVPDVFTRRGLVTRNSSLFGALVVGAALGPSMSDLEADGAAYALAAIFAFYLIAAGTIAVRTRSRTALPAY